MAWALTLREYQRSGRPGGCLKISRLDRGTGSPRLPGRRDTQDSRAESPAGHGPGRKDLSRASEGKGTFGSPRSRTNTTETRRHEETLRVLSSSGLWSKKLVHEFLHHDESRAGEFDTFFEPSVSDRVNHSIRNERDVPGGRRLTLYLESNGDPLPGVLLLPATGPAPAALLLHGFMLDKERMADHVGTELLARGIASLEIDL